MKEKEKYSRTNDTTQNINQQKSEKYERAKNRVEKIKGFYIHSMVYLVINTMLTIIKIVGTSYYGETFMGPFWHFSTLASWLFWGIGLLLHGLMVFKFNRLFNKDWEERQIQKYLEED